MKDKKSDYKVQIAVIIISILFVFLVFYNLPKFLEQGTSQSAYTQVNNSNQTFEVVNISKHNTTIIVPAVDNEGNGIPVSLSVEAIPGEGRTLVNINQILFWVDTQQSIRTARDVAQTITNMNLSKIDLIYSIETEANVIEGPSAGAALTIATISVLENKTLNKSVMITGTINPDGTIGPVGGILAKANAAKEVGATLFLVPEGQGIQTNYEPIETCKKLKSFTYCKIEYVPEKVPTSTASGVEVEEVGSIEDALKYFFQ